MKILDVKQIGTFDNEYVYDLEMSDKNNQHFYANDILVHNSNYATFQELRSSCDWDKYEIYGTMDYVVSSDSEWVKINDVIYKDLNVVEQIIKENNTEFNNLKYKAITTGKDLIKKIYEFRLAKYLNDKFDEYAKKRQTKNHQNFELEMICDHGLWLAKKKYVYNPVYEVTKVKELENGDYKLGGIDIESLSDIGAKGVEIIQSSTPPFARKHLKGLIRYIFENSKSFNVSTFIRNLRKLKDEFVLSNIEDISFGTKINVYHKYILNDTTSFEIAKGAMDKVKSAGYYNYLLNNDALEFKKKYPLIRDGTKIKYYLTKSKNPNLKTFGYLPNAYPYEFAPDIDMDAQFHKAIIKPINRFVEVMGYNKIDKALRIVAELF